MAKIETERRSVYISTLEENPEIKRVTLSHPKMKSQYEYTHKAIEHSRIWTGVHNDDFIAVLLLNLLYQEKHFSPFIAPGEEKFPLTLTQALDNGASNCLLLPLIIACRLKYAGDQNGIPKNRYRSILTVISYYYNTLAHGVLIVHDRKTKRFHTIHADTATSPSLTNIWNEEIPGTAILKSINPTPTFKITDKYNPNGTAGHFVSPQSALLFNRGMHLLNLGDNRGIAMFAKLSDRLPIGHPLSSHASAFLSKLKNF